jgi:hypothetical protein
VLCCGADVVVVRSMPYRISGGVERVERIICDGAYGGRRGDESEARLSVKERKASVLCVVVQRVSGVAI